MNNYIKCSLYEIEKKLRKKFEVPSFFDDRMIIAASFPKSGNTWFRFIVSNINNIICENKDHIDFHSIIRYSPEIRRDRNLREAVFISNYPIFLKTHAPFSTGFKRFKSLLIVRDPADVMISYYIYLRDEKGREFKDISAFIKHWRYGVSAWINFHLNWLGNWDYCIRYEDLLKNPLKEILGIYNFFKYNVDEEVVAKALELSSKENMRKSLKEKGDPCSNNVNFQFVRKGISGEGKVRLNEIDFSYIKKECKEMAIKLGYDY